MTTTPPAMAPAQLEQDEIEAIIELARAEATRWNDRSTNLTHVAYVLGQLFRNDFDRHFGKFGRIVLEGLLRAHRSCGSIKRARTMLESASSIDDAMRSFHEYLAFPEILVEDMEQEAHEAWMVRLIQDRFNAYARRRNNETLDELYVLIAALKVAGLEDAHQAMKAQLLEARG